MDFKIPMECGEFLSHYTQDLPLRWSAADLADQRRFVQGQIMGKRWLDWSTESAAFELLQARLLGTAPSLPASNEIIILAGPVAELIDPDWLFATAAVRLRPGGKLIGIIPCLRDNSPESRCFGEFAATHFRTYSTEEELIEMLDEAGLDTERDATSFVANRSFIEAVRQDQLSFKGFRHIFDRLASEGYDPSEVGWGELRFAARRRSDEEFAG